MVFAARCLSERLWGSAGASEPPPSLHGEKGRKEEVSLGEWLAPCLIMLWLYLEGESEAASKCSALLSSLHRGAERGSVVIFPADSVVLLGFPSLLFISGCIRAKQSLGVPLLLSRLLPEEGVRTLVLLII